jgi:methenyltetrahydromethanopterin cyclohydrolase
MKFKAYGRAVAGVLAAAALTTGALAQTQPATMTDTAPTPAHDRGSLGAVIMMDQPVLAQREAMQQAQERSAVDTRSMGAGPARLLRGAQTREDLEDQRAQDAANRQRGTPK